MTKSVLSLETVELVSSSRIKKEERNENFYYYDVRHADDCGFTPAEISPSIWANHMFTIALNKPLEFIGGFSLILTEEDEDILFKSF